jgi:predicted phage baseplate assembly protein
VTNPVRTWGGAEAESVAEGEKQASRYLQHRDRLVSAADFESIAWRTPGVDLGRVDVLPTFSPQLAPSAPGDAAGAVTLMLVPRYDASHPEAPEPDQIFLDTVCDWLDPRRLVTTEVFLRGPTYVDVWLSVGIEVDAGRPVAVVREAVRSELRRFLAPVDPEAPPWFEETPLSLDQPYVHRERGWPLGKPVVRLELVAIATRVPGVRLVSALELASGTGGDTDSVELRGLELPRIRGISVVAGPPVPLDQLRGQAPPDSPTPTSSVPVPLIPENC